MKFSLKDWRRFYDRAHELGKRLKEAKPDKDGNPPIAPLDIYQRQELENEINATLIKSDRYLKVCGVRNTAPLWIYNPNDKRTWVSHESFAYEHLLKY